MRIIAIHPSTNSNSRTARLVTDLLAYTYGYQAVVLYLREHGEARTHYLAAIRQADAYDLRSLKQFISAQLRPLM
jgi:cell filamentation protein